MSDTSPLDGAVTIVQNKVDPLPVMNKEGIDSNPMLESFFHIEQPTTKQKEQLKLVNDYLNEQEGSDMDKLMKLRDIRYRLADSSLFGIYKYIKFRSMAKSFETQAKALEDA
jgi:hypothetical protein